MRMTIHYWKLRRYLTDHGYGEHEARSTIQKLRRVSPPVKRAFFLWFLRDVRPELTVEGVSFQELAEQWQMSEINALLTLDWLEREPQQAKAALSRPVDHVVTGEKAADEIRASAPEAFANAGPEEQQDLTLE